MNNNNIFSLLKRLYPHISRRKRIQFFLLLALILLSSFAEVISIGASALKIIVLGLPVVGIQIVSSSIYQSLGKAKPAMFLSMLRQIIIFIPLVLILPRSFNLGIVGIWITYPISDLLSTAISGFMIRREMQSFKLEAEAEENISLEKF